MWKPLFANGVLGLDATMFVVHSQQWKHPVSLLQVINNILGPYLAFGNCAT